MSQSFYKIVERICEKDSRYREDAYYFIMEALSFTQKKFKNSKHVSGQEMLDGVKELLLERYGPMAMSILKHWGIRSTEDFGNIVFNLVDNAVLSKTEDDRIEHFQNVYDFEDVFNRGYRKQLAKKISRMRSF